MLVSSLSSALTILITILLLEVKHPDPDSSQHFVGEFFGGGIVFQIDEAKEHGLICSLSDIRDASMESNSATTIPNPERANDICASYTNSDFGTGTFSDWFLPTIDDLKNLYQVKDTINENLKKFNLKIVDYLDKVYWSSSKVKTDLIPANQLMDFENGTLIIFSTRPMTFVRAIRKF